MSALQAQCDKLTDELEEEQERIHKEERQVEEPLLNQEVTQIEEETPPVEEESLLNDEKDSSVTPATVTTAEKPHQPQRRQFTWRLKEDTASVTSSSSSSDAKPNSPTPRSTNQRSRSRSRTTSSSVLMIGMPKHERLPEVGIVSQLTRRFEEGGEKRTSNKEEGKKSGGKKPSRASIS